MTRIVADLPWLAELIDRLVGAQQELAGARAEIEGCVRAMGSEWSGEAAAAAALAHERWNAGADEVAEALTVIRRAAASARGNYAAAAAANRRMWSA